MDWSRAWTIDEIAAWPQSQWATFMRMVKQRRKALWGRTGSFHPRRMAGIKFDRGDKRFRQEVRARDGWRCRYCGQQFDPEAERESGERIGLEAAHIIGRGNKKVRYLVENGLSLCGVVGLLPAPGAQPWDPRIVCHRWFQDHPKEFEQFVIGQIGQHEYDRLRILANLRR